MLVTYRVPDNHRTKTVKGEKTLAGSVHHTEMTEFAGLITRTHEDHSCDLALLVPNRPIVHVERAAEGKGPGTFTRVAAAK